MNTTIKNPREIRRQLGLNQNEFWSRLGVTQSGGSRYESGRSIPRPVQALINAVYVHQIDLDKINSSNAPALRALLAGELDPEQLQQTAAEARDLLAAAGQLGVKAIDLSARIRAVTQEQAA